MNPTSHRSAHFVTLVLIEKSSRPSGGGLLLAKCAAMPCYGIFPALCCFPAHGFAEMMSLFEDDRYSWRETYFVLFQPEQRPRLSTVRRKLESRAGVFRIIDQQLEGDGLLKSLTLASYEDHSAMEILYQEGKHVQDEINGLADMLEKGCTPFERTRLLKARECRARFDIIHFEQTADTGIFQIVKMPDIRFAPRSGHRSGRGGFPKKPGSGKLGDNRLTSGDAAGSRFHFDPDSYENCRNDGAGGELDWEDATTEDSSVIERIDPNTLVLVLETLCILSNGVAIDPAAGVVI